MNASWDWVETNIYSVPDCGLQDTTSARFVLSCIRPPDLRPGILFPMGGIYDWSVAPLIG
jgi:hypothetical protein